MTKTQSGALRSYNEQLVKNSKSRHNGKAVYFGVVSFVDYTKFNDDTEDWSGETSSFDINEIVKASNVQELHEKLANVCNTTVSNFDTYFDKETNTFTQEEDGVLADYYVETYKAEKVEL